MIWFWKDYETESCSVVSNSLWPRGLYSPWNSPGQNTGMGSLLLLQGSSQSRDWTQVSHIVGRFFTSWATAAKSHQSCPTLWPHRQQPTRLCRPWDSPGKNTGVGCHFLLQCMKVKGKVKSLRSCPTPSDPMDCSLPGSSVHGIF